MKRQIRKITALALAAAVALTVFAISPNEAKAAEKKTAVWVVTKTKSTTITGENGDVKQTSVGLYSYNQSGLLKKITSSITIKQKDWPEYDYEDTSVSNYIYDKKYRLKMVSGYKGLKYDKKGRLIQYKQSGGYKTTIKYNKKGQCSSVTTLLNNALYEKITYEYDAKGRVKSNRTQIGKKYYDKTPGYSQYTYDKKGRIKSRTDTWDGDTMVAKYKRTYRGGRQTKEEFAYESRLYQTVNVQDTTTYQYKKVKVNSALAKKIKAQQKGLVGAESPLGMLIEYANN